MIPGTTRLGALPLATLPAALDASTPDLFKDLVAGLASAAQLVFLVEAMPYDPDLARQVNGLPAPLGVLPLGAGPRFAVIGSETKVRASDKGFVSGAADDPAHTAFPARIEAPLEFSATLFDGPEPLGRASTQFGELALANGDAVLDPWLAYHWEGRAITVKAGLKGWTLAQFGVVLEAEAGPPEWDEEELRLPLRDRGARLERPVQQNAYIGTGGLEGAADLAGQPKPLAFGRVLNARPQLLDAGLLIYQIHDGQVQDIDAVRDKGIALTDAGDLALAAILDPTTVVAGGSFASNLANGLIRLGATPAGQVTADLRGDVSDGVHAATAAAIAQHIVTRRLGGASLDTASQVDGGAFNDLARLQPAGLGLFVDGDGPSAAAVLDRLLGSIGAAWSSNREGFLTVRRLEAPGAPVAALGRPEIGRITRLETAAPSWRRRVAYRPVWTVQRDEDLAAAAPDAVRELVGQAARLAEEIDGGVLGANRLARDVALAALYELEADARAEALRALALHGPRRDSYELDLAKARFAPLLGLSVRISYPRFGLDAGRDFVVIGEQQGLLSDRKTLTVWG